MVAVSDTECDDRRRPTDEQNCTAKQCSGVWLAGPFGKVTAIFLSFSRLKQSHHEPGD